MPRLTRKACGRVLRQEDRLTTPTLRSSLWALILTVTWLNAAHHAAMGWGFLIGGLLSVFSLWTLTVVVPMFFQPGASRFAKAILLLTLCMKLPVFALALYVGTHLHTVAPIGMMLGIALTPMVITARTIADMQNKPIRAAKPVPEPVRPRPARCAAAEPEGAV